MTKEVTKSKVKAPKRWEKKSSGKTGTYCSLSKEPTLASLNGYTAEEWITRREISRMCNPAFDMAMYVEELDESLG